jgi:hypothetical protein
MRRVGDFSFIIKTVSLNIQIFHYFSFGVTKSATKSVTEQKKANMKGKSFEESLPMPL